MIIAAIMSHQVAYSISEEDAAAYLRVKQALESGDQTKRVDAEKIIGKAKTNLEKKERETATNYAASDHLRFIPEASKLRIRRTFADLLSLESGELGDLTTGQAKAIKDTKGALFSYTNDLDKSFDTWTAQGALIWPLIFETGVTPGGGFSLPLFGIMPSVTLNRFSTNQKPKDEDEAKKLKLSEKDELSFRLGVFGQLDISDSLFAVVRANGVWQTDTGFRSAAPGVEFEVEPLFQLPAAPWIGLGLFAVPEWAKKKDWDGNDPKKYRAAWLGYQARLRGRWLWGSIEDDGTGKRGDDFSRAGFTAELNLQPFIAEPLTASVSWTYMPAFYGPVMDDHYLEATVGYVLWEDPKEAQKITLEAKYLWGAQDNIGQKMQEQITVGLSVLY